MAFFSIFTHTVNGVPLPLISLLVALLGIFWPMRFTSRNGLRRSRSAKLFGPLYRLVSRKYFFDELYENIIVKTGAA